MEKRLKRFAFVVANLASKTISLDAMVTLAEHCDEIDRDVMNRIRELRGKERRIERKHVMQAIYEKRRRSK